MSDELDFLATCTDFQGDTWVVGYADGTVRRYKFKEYHTAVPGQDLATHTGCDLLNTYTPFPGGRVDAILIVGDTEIVVCGRMNGVSTLKKVGPQLPAIMSFPIFNSSRSVATCLSRVTRTKFVVGYSDGMVRVVDGNRISGGPTLNPPREAAAVAVHLDVISSANEIIETLFVGYEDGMVFSYENDKDGNWVNTNSWDAHVNRLTCFGAESAHLYVGGKNDQGENIVNVWLKHQPELVRTEFFGMGGKIVSITLDHGKLNVYTIKQS